jgi:hypothetical protein
MSRYEWLNIDSRLNWIAKDCDGRIYGYSHKPHINPWGYGLTEGFAKHLFFLTNEDEWQDSLEERPSEQGTMTKRDGVKG